MEEKDSFCRMIVPTFVVFLKYISFLFYNGVWCLSCCAVVRKKPTELTIENEITLESEKLFIFQISAHIRSWSLPNIFRFIAAENCHLQGERPAYC